MVNTAAQPAGMTSWVAIIDRLAQLLTSQPVYPCFVLTHPEIDKLDATAQRLAHHFGWPALSIGTTLSQSLLPIPPHRRPLQTRPLLYQALRPLAPGPVICTEIDLLFEPSLSLDPLRLLRDASRQMPLAVLWPGTGDTATLSYAVPEHAHYRTWPRTDLGDGCILPL